MDINMISPFKAEFIYVGSYRTERNFPVGLAAGSICFDKSTQEMSVWDGDCWHRLGDVGSALDEPNEPVVTIRICPSCGAPVNRSKRHCEYCGVPYPLEYKRRR